MKKVMILLVSVLMIGFTACSSTNDVTLKQNWIFTVTTVQSFSPASADFPNQTVVTTIEEDNLTSAEADQMIKEMSTTTSMTAGGETITMTISVTKAVKK